MRIVSSLIPGIAVIASWIFIMMGKAADYDAGDLVLDTRPPLKSKARDTGLSLQDVL